MIDISAIRKDYRFKELNEAEVNSDPIIQFRSWWSDAMESKIEEVNAMTLATADENGKPSSRIVLLKGFDEKGFVFFTNYKSRKAADLETNPQASLVFFWKELERQVRIDGVVEKISEKESDTYFQSRPQGSRIGAWASPQSQEITSRLEIEKRMEELQKKYTGYIPCPPHWGGYIVKPLQIEFWQGRPNRLHDRICFTLTKKNWVITRLAP
ncbi:MAG: pyridoxamine 5'-phosphate oxidase [Ferruginibacter sp.]